MATVKVLRETRVTTLHGHAFILAAGDTEVPDSVVADCMRFGAVEVGESAQGKPESKMESSPEEAPEEAPETRRTRIERAITELLSLNDPAHFNTNGQPKVGAVRERMGDDSVKPAEVSGVWADLTD